jgi:hypothetical protein
MLLANVVVKTLGRTVAVEIEDPGVWGVGADELKSFRRYRLAFA